MKGGCRVASHFPASFSAPSYPLIDRLPSQAFSNKDSLKASCLRRARQEPCPAPSSAFSTRPPQFSVKSWDKGSFIGSLGGWNAAMWREMGGVGGSGSGQGQATRREGGGHAQQAGPAPRPPPNHRPPPPPRLGAESPTPRLRLRTAPRPGPTPQNDSISAALPPPPLPPASPARWAPPGAARTHLHCD